MKPYNHLTYIILRAYIAIGILCSIFAFSHCRCTKVQAGKALNKKNVTASGSKKLSCTTSQGAPIILEQKKGKYQALLIPNALKGSNTSEDYLPVIFETGYHFETLLNLPPAERSQYIHLVPNTHTKGHIQVGKPYNTLQQPITQPLKNSTSSPNTKGIKEANQSNTPLEVSQDGRTALHEAVYLGEPTKVTRLLAKGAIANSIDAHGNTPLHVAAYLNNTAIAAHLLDHNASINALNTSDYTPLDIAAQQGHLEMIRLLKEKGAKINEAYNKQGHTPLHLILLSKHQNTQPLIKYLLQQGADVNLPDHDGMTALHLAAMKSLPITRDLIDHGAFNNHYTRHGATPLHAAAMHGCLEVVQYFIEEKKLPIDLRGSKLGYTILHGAVAYNQPPIVDYLLNKKANTALTSNEDDTPLHTAISRGYSVIAMKLITAGANLSARNKQGLTPIDLISINDHLDYLPTIFTTPAVERDQISSEDGLTHVARTVQRGDLDLLKQLVRLGCDLHLTDALWGSLLHEAAKQGHLSITRYLVEEVHLSLNAVDQQGKNPLQCAQDHGQQEVVAYLKEKND